MLRSNTPTHKVNFLSNGFTNVQYVREKEKKTQRQTMTQQCLHFSDQCLSVVDNAQTAGNIDCNDFTDKVVKSDITLRDSCFIMVQKPL